jgi:hypothetical protein
MPNLRVELQALLDAINTHVVTVENERVFEQCLCDAKAVLRSTKDEAGSAATEVIVRHASDDFSAVMTANAMESAGATVISVTPDQQSIDSRGFLVFARLGPGVSDRLIDERISAMF